MSTDSTAALLLEPPPPLPDRPTTTGERMAYIRAYTCFGVAAEKSGKFKTMRPIATEARVLNMMADVALMCIDNLNKAAPEKRETVEETLMDATEVGILTIQLIESVRLPIV